MGFRKPKVPTTKPEFTGVQVQTASSTLPVTLLYGRNRIAGNLWDYADFQSHEHTTKTKTGKGFGGSTTTTTYTYSATVVVGLCEGEIADVGRAWKSDGSETTAADLGFTVFVGSMPQGAWGYMATAHPDHADHYPGLAYLAQANMDLGETASLQSLTFEPHGILDSSQVGGTGDADPALMIDDFLTDGDHGCDARLADLLDYDALLSSVAATTTGDSAYQTYCRAMGFGLSPAMSDQDVAATTLERWCLLTNTAPVWTGFSLKLVPWSAADVAGHGVTFKAPTAKVFDLTDADFFQDEGDTSDPVVASRSDEADGKNIVKLTVLDRDNAYNPVPVTWQEDNSIALYGRREGDAIEAKEVCEPDMAGVMVALFGQRMLFVRNQYQFRLDPRFDLLEPMDCGAISDPVLGADIPVRILEIEEGEDDVLSITAEHLPATFDAGTGYFSGSLGAPPDLTTAGRATPVTTNSLAAPGPVNPPILFEPSASLAQALYGSTAARVLAAVSGGDGTTANPNWGGANVWLSTDDVTYQPVGVIGGPARMGTTTSVLAAYALANPDTVDTLGVTLLMSNGELTGVTSADAAAGASLCYVDGEILGFKDATLTGPNAYTLGGELYRGLHGSAAAGAASGVDFVRLDGAVFDLVLQPAYVGRLIYLKFQSFNVFGNSLEDLSTCTAYTFTPTGSGFSGADGGTTGAPAPAGEDLGAYQLVNIYDDAGVAKLRKADATTAGKEAHAFVAAAALTGDAAIPSFFGEIGGFVGLTPGAPIYLDIVAGGASMVAPSASGNVVQVVGYAVDATKVRFSFHPTSDVIP